MNEKGMIHIYTGDGKGKTTAAVGLAVRCKGAGNKVLFVQFMKGMQTGEIEPLMKLGICVFRKERIKKFIFSMTEEEKLLYKEDQNECFLYAREHKTEYDLIILDELMSAINTGMISEDEVLFFLKNKPCNLEVILTGRDPGEKLINCADYISEIKAIRHPYEKGIGARKGIEY